MTRHASIHAAGVVIAPKPLTEFVSLYKSQKNDNEITTQWSMKEIERMGLLKMDFLGQHPHAARRRGQAHQRDHGRRHRTREAAIDYLKTFALFCAGKSTACSSLKARACATRCARPSRSDLEDLIANALYRPGPLKGGVVDSYINRRHGREEIKYELPQMETVLKESYGVIAYQEQVMRLASELALHARRSRPAAQGDGQEERGRHAGAARTIPERRQGQGH